MDWDPRLGSRGNGRPAFQYRLDDLSASSLRDCHYDGTRFNAACRIDVVQRS